MYQYDAFRTIDRALTQAQLRAFSTLTRISLTRFVNEYPYGDCKRQPNQLMERYFDVHFCYSNWGTRIVMFRVPKRLLDPKLAATHCRGHVTSSPTRQFVAWYGAITYCWVNSKRVGVSKATKLYGFDALAMETRAYTWAANPLDGCPLKSLIHKIGITFTVVAVSAIFATSIREPGDTNSSDAHNMYH
jgi:hypothetical protein